MTIRPAILNDLPAIQAIFNHEILHSTAIYAYAIYSEAEMAKWLTQKMTQNLPVIIAEADGQCLGFATYGPFRLKPAYQYTAEHTVYTHKDHRKKGVATALMLHLIGLAKNNGIHSLIGGIDADNHSSIYFHEQLGFNTVGHLSEVGFKFDRWLDLKFMQLKLNQ